MATHKCPGCLSRTKRGIRWFNSFNAKGGRYTWVHIVVTTAGFSNFDLMCHVINSYNKIFES